MKRMPVIFVGHGSPTNAIEDNEFSREWARIGEQLPAPRAILAVSAHWYIKGSKVTAMDKPETIHDFFGFPKELFDMQYPAPGSKDLAERVIAIAGKDIVKEDLTWGLDHGTWSVLCKMFPSASVPVVQLSLDSTRDEAWHFEFSKKLKPLRDEGILIIASGNIVHNLGRIVWEDRAFDWAIDFDKHIKECILKKDYKAVVGYKKYGEPAQLSVPTNDHFLPLLYALGAGEDNEKVSFFCEKTTMGAISMRGVMLE